MTAGGWIMLVCFWGLILGLTVFCLARIGRGRP